MNANSLCIDSQVTLRRSAERICQSKYETWESVIKYWESHKYIYRRWIDTLISCEDVNENFSRLIDEYKIYINKGKIKYIDILYKFADIH